MADESHVSAAGSTNSIPDNSTDTVDPKKREEMETRATAWEHFEKIFENVLALSKKLDMWRTNVTDGKHLYVRCIARILNLIVQDGLKEIGPSIKRATEKFEKVFERFDHYDDNFNSYLATDVYEDDSVAGLIHSDDWVSVRNVIKFFEIFYELTSKVSGSCLKTNTLRNKFHMKKKLKGCGSIGGTKSKLDKYLSEDQEPVPEPGSESESEDLIS
ncbi:hypothetical protein BC332_20910 [Capsicum chinense]|nr:hypothetical protein BC332_20910 [Capsicum chinense]